MPFRRRRAAPPPAAAPHPAAGAAVGGTHVLLVRDPAGAEAVAARARAAGYGVTLDTADGGYTWIVRAGEPVGVAGAEGWLVALAAAHGGEYEGREA